MTLPVSTAATQANDHDDSVMICLRPSLDHRDVYSSMNVTTEKTDDLHITLWFGGTTEDLGGEFGRERLYRACYAMAIDQEVPAGMQRLSGKVNGFGWFLNEDTASLIALWDIPYIAEFRARLTTHLADHGVPMREENHGFTPHMTLSSQDETDHTIPEVPLGGGAEVDFSSIWLVWGSDWQEIPLM